MTNEEKLKDAFIAGLNVPTASFHQGLTYNTIAEWDSTGHMALVVAIEAAFEVMLDMDDIIDMNCVAAARDILSKHGVDFSA
jgi:acyl carrier protein